MPVFRPVQTDSDQMKQIRELTKAAREALKQPTPDTFLGRKTQEPFPREGEESRIEPWLNSKKLWPPK
jgi:hypothetical protein